MEKAEFEVGKFYVVHPFPTYGVRRRGIAAMVLRRTKTKVVFAYLSRNEEGLRKAKVERRVLKMNDGVEEATGYGKWDSIVPTKATQVCAKPSAWDGVPDPADRR